jgi:hypothetical protein
MKSAMHPEAREEFLAAIDYSFQCPAIVTPENFMKEDLDE